MLTTFINRIHGSEDRCFVTENYAMSFGEICYWESSGFNAGVHRLIVTIRTPAGRSMGQTRCLSLPPACFRKGVEIGGGDTYQLFVPKLELLFYNFILLS
jgi:hypothetical protein